VRGASARSPEIARTEGRVFTAEVHWYEASGLGRREFKIKRILDE
jgi:hypothetical protein